MKRNFFIEEKARVRIALIMSRIEFMGAKGRLKEVASVYKYLGINDSSVREFKNQGPWIEGMYSYVNMLGSINITKTTSTPDPGCIRLALPNYDISVTNNSPVELMYFLTQKQKSFKKKFNEINSTIIDNKKKINNAKESIANNVEIVNDFLGNGNKNVINKDFKAYITGLSIVNHRLKKRAKLTYTKYMKIKELQDIILHSYITEEYFDKFYKEFCDVCKQHKKENEPSFIQI